MFDCGGRGGVGIIGLHQTQLCLKITWEIFMLVRQFIRLSRTLVNTYMEMYMYMDWYLFVVSHSHPLAVLRVKPVTL